jgi:hypothetical protein
MTRSARREGGSALFVAVMMLVLMGFLGLMALDRVTRDQQVAGYMNRSRTAFYAAEAGVAAGRAIVRETNDRSSKPALPAQYLGDTSLYDVEGGLPQYGPDPAFADPIRYIGETGTGAEGGNLQMKGQKFAGTLWQINVVGESPDGSETRLEVMEVRVLSSGY